MVDLAEPHGAVQQDDPLLGAVVEAAARRTSLHELEVDAENAVGAVIERVVGGAG